MSVAAVGSGVLRITHAFARARAEGRLAIAVYLTVGFPDRGATDGLLRAALDGGADLLELGVPFSDPVADGVTVQRASQVALHGATGLQDCIDAARELRQERDACILLMGYTNPFLRYGFARFARAAEDAGVAGVIVPDLPAEEGGDVDEELIPHGIARIDLYAPTTPDARLDLLLPGSRGFAYCVSLTGVTGARTALASDVAEFVARVRARTELPVAVGFGISRPQHVSALRGIADGVVVGSAAIDAVANAAPGGREAALRAFVGSLAAAARS